MKEEFVERQFRPATLDVDNAISAIERWQCARVAACEVGVDHPEFRARWDELANAEHQLMRIKI